MFSKRSYSIEFKTAIKLCECCQIPLKLINSRDLKRKRFCSYTCKKDYQKGKPSLKYTKTFFSEKRKCKSCGSEYVATDRLKKYCSKKCLQSVLSKRSSLKNNDLVSHVKRLLVYKGREALTTEYILDLYNRQNGCCALSGLPMTWKNLSGRVGTNLSIDRISSNRDYSTDNIQLVCYTINMMKQSLDTEEFVDMCSKVVEKRHPK